MNPTDQRKTPEALSRLTGAASLEAEGNGDYRHRFDKLNDRGETQNQEHTS